MCLKFSVLRTSLSKQVWVTYLGKERKLSVNLCQETNCSKRGIIWCLHIVCIYYFCLSPSRDITVLTLNLIILLSFDIEWLISESVLYHLMMKKYLFLFHHLFFKVILHGLFPSAELEHMKVENIPTVSTDNFSQWGAGIM